MAFSNGYIVGFAGVVCVVCSVAVATAATALKPLQDLNKERDLHKSILVALDLVDDGAPVTGEEIDTLWDTRVELAVFKADGTPVAADQREFDLDGDNDVDIDDIALARDAVKGTDAAPSILGLYKRTDDGQVKAWALPVFGMGLWGPISGYLALDASLETVTAVTFSAPKETPGLGAEIMEAPFKAAWVGKKIFKDGKPHAIAVVKPGAAKPEPDYAVDGVSGATITSRGVSEMVEDGVEHDYAAILVSLHR